MEPVTGMAAIITDIGSLVTAAGSWVSTTVGTFMASGNELLLFSGLIGFVGIGISLLRRMFKLHV